MPLEKMPLAVHGFVGLRLWTGKALTFLFILAASLAPSGLLGQTAQMTSNNIRLYWTAPGDDNMSGRAARYDIRYSTTPIGDNIDNWWASAIIFENTPVPSRAGLRDSCTVPYLSIDQPYYFAVRAADEADNWSHISNIAYTPKLSCADVNGDESVNILDIVYLLASVYDDEAPPPVDNSGDMDNSGYVNVIDIIYLINYRFKYGPPPICD